MGDTQDNLDSTGATAGSASAVGSTSATTTGAAAGASARTSTRQSALESGATTASGRGHRAIPSEGMLSALEMREMLRRGDVSATELVLETLKRIEADSSDTDRHGAGVAFAPSARDRSASDNGSAGASNGASSSNGGGNGRDNDNRSGRGDDTTPILRLGAFVSVQAELALNEAKAIDRRIAETPKDERHLLPPLLGLPTAHKDLVAVRGFVTTHGSAAVPHGVAESDDPIAAAVRHAGAICVGKTQVPEFGIAGYSENLIAAPARNPFDRSRTVGGSSGGTAAAIAGGMIAAAIGSDAGGSVRIPSAACGLVGLKPGRGTVPADAVLGLTDDLGVPRMGVSGPMAHSVRDAALLFDAIMGGGAGVAVTDINTSTNTDTNTAGAGHPPVASALEAIDHAHELRGMRIGVSIASPFEARMPILFDDAALAALQRAAALLESLGHHVEEAAIDYGEHYPRAFTTVWTQALARIPFADGAETRLGSLAKWFLEQAREASPEQIAWGVASLGEFARRTAQQWGEYDAVLTPALAHTAPEVGEFWARGPAGDYRLQCEWAPQTSVVNVVGVPAVTVPLGYDATGMPRGVQLIGRMSSEVRLLQLAEQLTQSF